jgi:hypothetical protein
MLLKGGDHYKDIENFILFSSRKTGMAEELPPQAKLAQEALTLLERHVQEWNTVLVEFHDFRIKKDDVIAFAVSHYQDFTAHQQVFTSLENDHHLRTSQYWELLRNFQQTEQRGSNLEAMIRICRDSVEDIVIDLKHAAGDFKPTPLALLHQEIQDLLRGALDDLANIDDEEPSIRKRLKAAQHLQRQYVFIEASYWAKVHTAPFISLRDYGTLLTTIISTLTSIRTITHTRFVFRWRKKKVLTTAEKDQENAQELLLRQTQEAAHKIIYHLINEGALWKELEKDARSRRS